MTFGMRVVSSTEITTPNGFEETAARLEVVLESSRYFSETVNRPTPQSFCILQCSDMIHYLNYS